MSSPVKRLETRELITHSIGVFVSPVPSSVTRDTSGPRFLTVTDRRRLQAAVSVVFSVAACFQTSSKIGESNRKDRMSRAPSQALVW